MDKEPLISILTPVYNQSSYIRATMHSVLNQTYKNWEWIIVDDGSVDDTRDIINSYKDERIRYFYQEHAGIDGICAAHNKALGLSEGEFIALLDGDDLWPEYKLDMQVKGFVNDGAVLSYGECCLIDSEGVRIDYVKTPRDKRSATNMPVGISLQEFLLQANAFIYNPTVLILKSALEKIGGFVVYKGLSQDFPTWCRLALEGTFIPVPHCLGYWRKHGMSVTFHNAEYRFRNKIQFIKEFGALHREEIRLLGFDLVKDIDESTEKRAKAFGEYLSYDRAMLLAKMGMFKEAGEEFNRYLKEHQSFKNMCIHYLFSMSERFHYDIVNPVRRMNETVTSIAKGA
jgi:glycosyltransferase involved in cell wall biosynthesis